MEYASYLAGERWSDHPACTHPLLALIAREVNDETSDAGRPALAPLIPSVIGLTADDHDLAPVLVMRCVRTVLPLVSPAYQRVLAEALRQAHARLTDVCPPSKPSYDRAAALALAGTIRAVSDFRVRDADAVLRRLLVDAIDECRRRQAQQPAEPPLDERPAAGAAPRTPSQPLV